MTYLPDYHLVPAENLSEACAAVKNGARPLAGGTDIMVYLEAGNYPAGDLVDLKSISELSTELSIEENLELGALTSYRQIRESRSISERWPLLGLAAREVGVIAVQSMGTWAGNIANASPAADGVPALMAYDALVAVSDGNSKRKISLHEYYKGYKKTALGKGELITSIIVPAAPSNRREYFRKVGARRFQAISKTLLAGWITMKENTVDDIRLVFGSVAPHTLRVRETEQALRGKTISEKNINSAVAVLQAEISPLDDIRSTEKFRRKVSENLLRDFLRKGAMID